MKIYAERITPPVAEKRVIECTHAVCDICGEAKTSGEPIEHSGECNWATKPYDIHETTVTMTVGRSYEDGDSKCLISAHVCPECFDEQLLPFIRSFRKQENTGSNYF